MKVIKSFTLDKELIEWLKVKAYKINRSMSWFVNNLINTEKNKEK